MLQTAPNPIYVESNTNEIVQISSDSSWELNVPAQLESYSNELICLLDKVFKNCPKTEQNVELAKQLAINWCTAKCKELDIPVDTCINQLSL